MKKIQDNETAMNLLFLLGITCLPIGLFVSLSSSSIGTPEYSMNPHGYIIGQSVYSSGFFFVTIAWLLKRKCLHIIPVLFVSVALIIGGVFLGTAMRTNASPLILGGFGVLGGALFAFIIGLKSNPPHTKHVLGALLICICASTAYLPLSTVKATNDLQITKISENLYMIRTDGLTVTIENLNSEYTNIRVTVSYNETIVIYELTGGSLICNGTKISAFSEKRSLSSVARTAEATRTFLWDGIQYISGQYIKYPHPDRDAYLISPFDPWSMHGNAAIHNQIDQATSMTLLVGGPALIGAAIGAMIGLLVGGPAGEVVGAIAGAIVMTALTWVGYVEFADEYSCI
ncbi:MAG: hypothetical protein QHH24_07685 [Candidatus Bathyarchaeota archaeon]|nr:hypothetical protein [Candidatus Bathyarchaeota archaeon]